MSCCALNARTRQIEGEFQAYVRPSEHRTLTAFCTELTGISQQQYVCGQNQPLRPSLRAWWECLRSHAPSCRVDTGVPLREALERLHSWLYQHGFIEPRSHSCPVTWTGRPLCRCRDCVSWLYFVPLSHHLPGVLVILNVVLAVRRLGPEGAAGAGTEVAQPCCPCISKKMVQPEGRLQQGVWAVSTPWCPRRWHALRLALMSALTCAGQVSVQWIASAGWVQDMCRMLSSEEGAGASQDAGQPARMRRGRRPGVAGPCSQWPG